MLFDNEYLLDLTIQITSYAYYSMYLLISGDITVSS